MGNTVSSDGSRLSIDDLIKTSKSHHYGALPIDKFEGISHNVRGFEFALGGGVGRAAVQCHGIDPSEQFRESSSVVVLHIQRTPTNALSPPSGACYPTPSPEATAFAQRCNEAFTPRGTASMFAVDVEALKWRLKSHKGDYVHSYKLYVYNGHGAPPLVSAVAVMNAFTLEQAIAGRSNLVEALFYNALTTSLPTRLSFPAKGGNSELSEEEVLELYRDHAFLRAMNNVLTPASSNKGALPGSPSRNRVSPTKAGSALPRLVLRSDIAADDTVPPAVHRFQTDPQPAAPIAPSTMSLAVGAVVAEDESDGYNDDRKARLKELMPIASEILPYLFVGGEAASEDKRQLIEKGITLVVNAAALAIKCHFEAEFEYIPLYLCDSPDEDIESVFPIVIHAIETARTTGGKVFVHCHQGVSRSTTLVISYLMWKHGWCFDEALNFAKDRRSIVSPNTGFLVKLMRWERHLSEPPQQLVWAYLPFTKQYALPFTFRPVVPEEGDATIAIDDRTCYGIFQRDTNTGRYTVSFFGGKCCSSDFKEDAANFLNDTRTYAFFSQAKPATSHKRDGSLLTFNPVSSNSVSDISDDPNATAAFNAALNVPTTMGRNSQLDNLLSNDVHSIYSEMLKHRHDVNQNAERRKHRRVEAIKELDEFESSAAALKAEEVANVCGVDSEEDADRSDHVTVFEYPFDSPAIEYIDREDLHSDSAYAIIVRGSKACSRPHQVFLWIGDGFADADDDEVIIEYDSNLVEEGVMISTKKALRSVKEEIVREGEEPQSLLSMID